MDIICLRCGKHLISVEVAREHKCHNLDYSAKPLTSPKVAPNDLVFDPLSVGRKDTPKIMTIEEFNKLWDLKKSHTPTGIKPTPKSKGGKKTTTKHQQNPKKEYKKPNRNVTLTARRLIPKPLIKLALNLLILTGLALLIKHSYQLFTTHPEEPLKGAIILILGLALWVATIKVAKSRSRHYWFRYRGTKPSFKLTTFSIIAIALILAFAGIQPMSTYKDKVLSSATSTMGKWQERVAVQEAEREVEKVEQEDEEQSPKITPVVPPKIVEIVPITPPKEIKIIEVTPILYNPSWVELKAFLWEDKTDQLEYIFPTFVCHDFAKTLQANAKEAGWRCAFVNVGLEGYPDWFNYGIPSNTGHSLNAFETTDKGLIYIDCTNSVGVHPSNMDSIVDVKIGNEYIPIDIFPNPGWLGYGLSMGTITEIETIKW